MVMGIILSSQTCDKQSTIMNKYQVTRTAHVIQTILVKANSESEAKDLARKSMFKDFATLNNKKRTDYIATKLA